MVVQVGPGHAQAVQFGADYSWQGNTLKVWQRRPTHPAAGFVCGAISKRRHHNVFPVKVKPAARAVRADIDRAFRRLLEGPLER
jgi:hypothetical protein